MGHKEECIVFACTNSPQYSAGSTTGNLREDVCEMHRACPEENLSVNVSLRRHTEETKAYEVSKGYIWES